MKDRFTFISVLVFITLFGLQSITAQNLKKEGNNHDLKKHEWNNVENKSNRQEALRQARSLDALPNKQTKEDDIVFREITAFPIFSIHYYKVCISLNY